MTQDTSIHPSSFRVWRGFRNSRYQTDRSGFVDKLSDIFIPLTCQAMMPLGLVSYIPTVIAESQCSLPDEIALVGYRDQATYESASHDTVIGRGYGMLHYQVFNFSDSDDIPSSQSGFPVHYTGQAIKTGQAYYFSGQSLDWNALTVTVFVVPLKGAKNDNDTLQNQLLSSVRKACLDNEAEEAILVVDPGYLVLWVAVKNGVDCPIDVSNVLVDSQGVVVSVAGSASVPPMWTPNEQGIPVQDNQTLNLSLSAQTVRSTSL